MTGSSNQAFTLEYAPVGFKCVLYVKPVPASRPRVTKWGTYYGKTYAAYRKAADEAIPSSTREEMHGPLMATMEFVCYKPKTTKRFTPVGDIDNHMKAILDALVGQRKSPKGYIVDDDQFVRVKATKRWAEPGEVPHTKLKVEWL